MSVLLPSWKLFPVSVVGDYGGPPVLLDVPSLRHLDVSVCEWVS